MRGVYDVHALYSHPTPSVAVAAAVLRYRFVVTDDQGHQIINGKLILPDHLHPTGAGMDVWSACVAEDIRSGLTKDP